MDGVGGGGAGVGGVAAVGGGSAVAVAVEGDGEVGVVETVAELEDGLAFVPHVGAAGVADGRVGAESHVGHGDFADVASWVLGDGESASRCGKALDDVEDGDTSVLAWIPGPQESRDVRVVDNRRVVQHGAHLHNDHGLAVLSETLDDVDLVAGPSNVVAVLVLSLDIVVDTSKVDDDIVRFGSGPKGLEVVRRGVVLASTGLVDNSDIGTSLVGCVRGTVEVGCDTEVVALHLLGSVGPISNNSDGHVAADMHGKETVVLEKDNSLLGSTESQLLGFLSVYILPAKAAVGGVGAVEVAQAHKRCVLANEGQVEVRLLDEALIVSAREIGRVVSSAVVVSASSECLRDDLLAGIVVTVRVVNVLNSTAVADNSLLLVGPVPVLTEHIVKKPRVRASRASIQLVVSAHEAEGVGISGALLEWRHVVLHKVARANLSVELVTVVAVPRLEIVSSEMLASRTHALDLQILTTLQTINQVLDVAAEMERILARSFLASSPSGVPEGVDVGCPCLQSRLEVVSKRAELGRDHGCDLVDQFIVESRTSQDGLWKGCCVAPLALLFELHTVLLGNAVKCFVPPDVRREPKARSTGLVLIGVGKLLFQSHSLDQSSCPSQRVRGRVADGVVPERSTDAVREVSSCSVRRRLG